MTLNVTYQNTYYFFQHFYELKKMGNEFEVKGEPTWFRREIFTPDNYHSYTRRNSSRKKISLTIHYVNAKSETINALFLGN